jgi:hypothetical protein
MRSVSYQCAAVACAIGVAGGIAAGPHLASFLPQSIAAQRESATLQRSSSATTHDWLAELESLDWGNVESGDWLPALQSAIHDDTQLRRAVVQRYLTSRTPELTSGLRRALTGNPAEDLPQTALTLAQDTDQDRKAAGWRLLADLPPSLLAYDLAKRTLLSPERDTDVIEGALRALRHPILPPPQDRRAILPRLLSLIHSDVPMVRAHSLQLLAEWDISGRLARPAVVRALSDPHAVVRLAAVGAVMVGQLKSDELKPALLAVLRSNDEEPDTHSAVLMALERFELDPSEYRLYLATWDHLEKRTGPGDATH